MEKEKIEQGEYYETYYISMFINGIHNLLYVTKILDKMTERERKIVCLSIGMNEKSHTIKEIAETMSYSRERIRQFEVVTYKKLTHMAAMRCVEGVEIDFLSELLDISTLLTKNSGMWSIEKKVAEHYEVAINFMTRWIQLLVDKNIKYDKKLGTWLRLNSSENRKLNEMFVKVIRGGRTYNNDDIAFIVKEITRNSKICPVSKEPLIRMLEERLAVSDINILGDDVSSSDALRKCDK